MCTGSLELPTASAHTVFDLCCEREGARSLSLPDTITSIYFQPFRTFNTVVTGIGDVRPSK